MTAQIIDGKALAAKVKADVAERVKQLPRPPGLAVVRVGDDAGSEIYVTSKEKTARELGFNSWQHHLAATTSQAELLALIATLNADRAVDGILVQLPLPKQIDSSVVLSSIDPSKDVDGFHPVNAGKLFQGRPGLVPCTPLGVMRMLEEIGFDPSGKRCVVVGRSTIVGRPMAMLLLNAHATVIICHSKSDVRREVERADLVVAAVGVKHLIRGEWIREGAVVIDVGMNRGPDGKLSGDVEFEAARERASFISPVPGGVGPMTIAMLMQNTLDSLSLRGEGGGEGK